MEIVVAMPALNTSWESASTTLFTAHSYFIADPRIEEDTLLNEPVEPILPVVE